MNKIRVGVTGYNGFIGYYLSTHIKYFNDDLILVPCLNDFFEDKAQLIRFVKQCDVIVHLAAMNRGEDKEIFETNIRLVNQLVGALENDIQKTLYLTKPQSHHQDLATYNRTLEIPHFH